MATQTARTEKLDIRLSLEVKQMLRTAALATNRSVSEFVLESAISRAEEALADRRFFDLDAEKWAAFKLALDAPSQESPRLKKLFHEQSIFERP